MTTDRNLTDDELDDQMRRFYQDVYDPVEPADETWRKLSFRLEAASLGNGAVVTPEPPARPAVTPRPAAHPSRTRQWLGSAAAVLVTVVIIVASVALFQGRGRAGQRGVRPTATAVTCSPTAIRAILPRDTSISSVALTSPTSGWAVGNIYSPTNGAPLQSVIAEFKDCRWSLVGPTLPEGGLGDISMTSPDDGWIIGGYGAENSSVLLHLVAGSWQRVTIPLPQATSANFSSLSMLSDTEGWIMAFVAKSTDGQTNQILFHLHNGVWSVVTMPFGGGNDIMAVSPGDAWVAGSTEILGQTSELYHYHQGKWTSVSAPTGMSVYSLHRNGPHDAWATGVVQTQGPTAYDQAAALLHFNGTSWAPVALDGFQNPAQEPYRQEVQMLSADEGWAVGITTEGVPSSPQVTLLQEYVAGTWKKVALPNVPLADITSFSCTSPDDCWAAGLSETIVLEPSPSSEPGGTASLQFQTGSLLHYYDGRWTVY